MGCGACVATCPRGALSLVDGKAKVDKKMQRLLEMHSSMSCTNYYKTYVGFLCIKFLNLSFY